MIKIINFGAIFLLIYYIKNVEEYTIQVSSYSTIANTMGSTMLNKIISYIQAFPTVWLVSLAILIAISLFIKSSLRYIGILIAILVLYISIQLISSELTLNCYTTLLFNTVQIYHPIPLESKLEYLQHEIVYCYSQLQPELLRYSLEELTEIKLRIESNVNDIYCFGMLWR
jgi:hypothetical protein